MASVQRSSQAERDLLDTWRFIARDDAGAADQQLDRIDAACRLLAENPRVGPSREDLAPGLRFYPVGNYLIFYTVTTEGIVVVRILHGSRDYRREFE